MARGMPRLDVLRARRDPAAYRSGFWAHGADRGPRSRRAAGRARAAGAAGRRREVEAPLARIPLAEPVAPASSAAPEVAICMATHEPPLDLFRRQVESIRAQTHERLAVRRLRRLLVARALRRARGRCSTATPASCCRARRAGSASTATSSARSRSRRAGARFVALADQDDAWHPEKLATLLAEIGDARLIYSDARIVERGRPARGPDVLEPAAQQPPPTCARCS